MNNSTERVQVDHQVVTKMRRSIAGFGTPLGVIALFAGKALPMFWLWCDGSEITREDHPKLFELLGVDYGAGDGESTFNLPNIPDMAPGIRYIIKMRGYSLEEEETPAVEES